MTTMLSFLSRTQEWVLISRRSLWDENEDAVFDTYILDASSGDTVNMTVQALNSSEGVFWLDNLSTGNSTSYEVTGGGLCMEQAEWIVEDPVKCFQSPVLSC